MLTCVHETPHVVAANRVHGSRIAPRTADTVQGLLRLVTAMALVAALPGIGRAQGDVIDDGPQHLNDISSIGESLRNAGSRPLHILYVHGIGATAAGDSLVFQQSVCKFLKHCTAETLQRLKQLQSTKFHGPSAPRDYADRGWFALGAPPPEFTYMGHPVWQSAEEWSASTPFVDHHVLSRTNGGPIVVDEINWWPMVLPAKCRDIMAGEARLAGPYKTILKVCSQHQEPDKENPGRFRAYTWVSEQEAKAWEALPAKGALVNRSLKNAILDWGFSDAMMAVGTMHPLFREAMRQLFLQSARFNADGTRTNDWEQQLKEPHGLDREFIVVSHSLGSYLVFSTLNMDQQEAYPESPAPVGAGSKATEDAAAQYIFERTSLVYFFANQIPLLELATMETPSNAKAEQGLANVQTETKAALTAQMRTWNKLRHSFGKKSGEEEETAAAPRQVVAWSDPSDLLTWRIPQMNGLVIDNLYVRNTFWRWIVAGPLRAHVNYDKNRAVIRVMMSAKKAAE